jgi:NAD(P)-dependent dehydrogenase (short-subunit alcohol dehydrogenase family)
MAARLSGKIALVFGGGVAGAGLGNGKAAAQLMAREGAQVVVADVNRDAAEQTCAAIAVEGGTAIPVSCNVAEPQQVLSAVQRCVSHFGRLDILLNNVGIGASPGLLSHDEEAWDHVFAVNVRGVYSATRHAVPEMLKNGYGRIINISSTAALRTSNGIASHAYAASKAAVIQFTRTVALEFASRGIRSNCVVPGMIDTPHASDALRRALPADQAERMIAARHAASPTGAQGTPWDVAHAVVYLASDESAYVNGAALVVDGGFTLATPAW